MSQIIHFADGIMVEIAASPDRTAPISGKSAERVPYAFQAATEMVAGVIRSFLASTSKELVAVGIKEAEIEFGIGFSLEGNIYVTKTKAEGNIGIRFKLPASD